MILLFELIILTSIWTLGLTIITQPGMALYSLREWAQEKKNVIYEPIILCHWCMASVHSIFGYFFATVLGLIYTFDWKYVYIYPLVAMGSSLLNGLVWGLHSNMDAKTEYYESARKKIDIQIDEMEIEEEEQEIFESMNN